MLTLPDIIEFVLKAEGGFVFNPDDKGGATNWGITAETLGEYRKLGRVATVKEVQELTQTEARQILVERYIYQPQFDKLQDGRLMLAMIDGGYNAGPRQATKWLQRALGVKDDGVIGKITLKALENKDLRSIAINVCAQRFKFYTDLAKDFRQLQFLRGWVNRCADILLKIC